MCNADYPPVSVVIIGGGLSGTLVAMQLLKQARIPMVIRVIERASEVGRGVAYSTPWDCHLLNVPVSAVSLVAETSHHFLRWLHQQGHRDVSLQSFVPRHWFGSYVQANLATAISVAPEVQFEAVADEAIRVTPEGNQASVYLQSGKVLKADRVVLALGNPPPGNVPIANPEFYQTSSYIPSGWSGDIEDLLERPSLLLIGAGLTAMDWVVALCDRNYPGTIHTLSRHGLLPQPHHPTPTYPKEWLATDIPPTTRGLLHQVRQEVRQAAQQGYGWRSVLDTLRFQVQALWVNLPLAEKQRFVRHLRPYWDSHRHRIAPNIGQIVQQLQASGQLQVHAAHLQTCQVVGDEVVVHLRRRGGTDLDTLTVGAVINCTGPQFNYRRLTQPLIQTLLDQGLIRPDPLALGIDVAADGAVISAQGTPSPWLYTLGPTCRGNLWETIAVTEIRDQAVALARTLLTIRTTVGVS